ncbi:MAG: GTP cyclohydrolase I [Gemmatimonadetes bacterium]|nr:GTP cyclohydrolase I [Gemmatimonadota bacterium]
MTAPRLVAALPMHKGKQRQALSQEEFDRFEGYLTAILGRLGLARGVPGTQDTPGRWLRAMIEMTGGYDGDPKLETVFPGECPTCPDEAMEQVVEGPISFFALCEHHALPIQGSAWIGYLAGHQILGISKLTRIVRLYAQRFTTQERITHEVANHLAELIRPQGVSVYLAAHHACTQARGVREPHSMTRTYAAWGAYNTSPRLRDEFMTLCGLGRARP